MSIAPLDAHRFRVGDPRGGHGAGVPPGGRRRRRRRRRGCWPLVADLHRWSTGLGLTEAQARAATDRLGRTLHRTFLGRRGGALLASLQPTAVLLDVDESVLGLPWEAMRSGDRRAGPRRPVRAHRHDDDDAGGPPGPDDRRPDGQDPRRRQPDRRPRGDGGRARRAARPGRRPGRRAGRARRARGRGGVPPRAGRRRRGAATTTSSTSPATPASTPAIPTTARCCWPTAS